MKSKKKERKYCWKIEKKEKMFEREKKVANGLNTHIYTTYDYGEDNDNDDDDDDYYGKVKVFLFFSFHSIS